MTRFEAPVEASGAAGWTWAHGAPGFHFGAPPKDWTSFLSELRPGELAEARAAAASVGIRPRSLGVLGSMRLAPHELFVIVAGVDAGDRTCLGFVAPHRRPSFFCPDGAGPRRLGPQLAFADVVSLVPTRGRYALFVLGVARGDVERVRVSQPGFSQVYYDRRNGAWGTFVASLAGNAMRLDLYGERGRIASLPLRFRHPAARLIAIGSPG